MGWVWGCRNLAPTPGGQPQRFGATWAGKGNSRQTIAARTTIDAKEPKIKKYRGLLVSAEPN